MCVMGAQSIIILFRKRIRKSISLNLMFYSSSQIHCATFLSFFCFQFFFRTCWWLLVDQNATVCCTTHSSLCVCVCLSLSVSENCWFISSRAGSWNWKWHSMTGVKRGAFASCQCQASKQASTCNVLRFLDYIQLGSLSLCHGHTKSFSREQANK